MRRLSLIILMVLSLVGMSSAQDGELTLKWDPVRNTLTGNVDISGTANVPDQFYFFLEGRALGRGSGCGGLETGDELCHGAGRGWRARQLEHRTIPQTASINCACMWSTPTTRASTTRWHPS